MKYCLDRPISTTFAMNHHLVVLHWFIPKPKPDVQKIRPAKQTAAVWGCASFVRRSYPAGLKRHLLIGELKTAEHTNRLGSPYMGRFYPELVSACFSVFKLMGQFFFSKLLFYSFWGNIQASLTNKNKQTGVILNWSFTVAICWSSPLGTVLSFYVEGEVYYLSAR